MPLEMVRQLFAEGFSCWKIQGSMAAIPQLRRFLFPPNLTGHGSLASVCDLKVRPASQQIAATNRLESKSLSRYPRNTEAFLVKIS
jgi:hypothetical protein